MVLNKKNLFQRKKIPTLKDSATIAFDILLQMVPDIQIWLKADSLLEYVKIRIWRLVIASGFKKITSETNYCNEIFIKIFIIRFYITTGT